MHASTGADEKRRHTTMLTCLLKSYTVVELKIMDKKPKSQAGDEIGALPDPLTGADP